MGAQPVRDWVHPLPYLGPKVFKRWALRGYLPGEVRPASVGTATARFLTLV